MVRIIDHTTRKNRILAATVAAYIRDGQPVSSQDLAEAFGLSPATIRAILSELEHDGYLSHPHTSAGRIPTDKGYRYYVDFLMAQFSIPQNEQASIQEALKVKSASLEELLETTTYILATMTHYTAIVSFPERADTFFYRGLSNIMQQPEFQDWQKVACLVQLFEEKRPILEIMNQEFDEPHKIYIGEEIGCSLIKDTCSLVVAPYHKRTKRRGKLAVLGPRRMTYEQTVSSIELVSNILDTVLDQI